MQVWGEGNNLPGLGDDSAAMLGLRGGTGTDKRGERGQDLIIKIMRPYNLRANILAFKEG